MLVRRRWPCDALAERILAVTADRRPLPAPVMVATLAAAAVVLLAGWLAVRASLTIDSTSQRLRQW